jgi:hypothetical protein
MHLILNPVRVLLVWLVLITAVNAKSGADKGGAPERPSMPETLDHKAVHKQYNEGDFESVVAALDGFMGRNRSFSHEDSVFIAKHLAVVYCANPDTREKGRYYMFRLLELVPSAKLVDMFVSEEIDRIFEKVRDEFRSRQAEFGSDSGRVAKAAPAPARESKAPALPPTSPPAPREKSGHLGFWLAGGAAVVAGAATAYLIYQDDEEPRPEHFHVPSTVKGE